MTRLLIGTSWKMNLTPSEASAWFATARPLLDPLTARRDLFVLPPAPAIQAARDALAGSAIGYGGQDIHPDDRGAHTGDVAASMLADLGARYAEIGHSERRRDHGETDALVAAKVRAALRWHLTPIVCVGETAEGPLAAAIRIVEAQLGGAFGSLAAADLDAIVVAYEPVWAIGEGAAAAAPAHVAAIHGAIDRWLAARGATCRRVLYGGSVDEANAAALLATPAVGGLFVGRAALDARRFAAIAAAPGPDDRRSPVRRDAASAVAPGAASAADDPPSSAASGAGPSAAAEVAPASNRAESPEAVAPPASSVITEGVPDMSTTRPILLGADDAGLGLLATLEEDLAARGIPIEVVRPDDPGLTARASSGPDDAVDYPDVAERVAGAIRDGRADRAILICGTGIGMAIAANKVAGVRAALAHDVYSAERARKSNNAQVLTLGARVIGPEAAKTVVHAWLESEFAGGASTRKVEKIDDLERRLARDPA